ncbi:MAG: hypothetical protein RJA13_1226 [Bacteroidota bacterium]|jgi:hypothetical protein
MNSLFDDSLLQSHSNSDPLLTSNDLSAFNHESHNDLFNQNLLPEAHQYHDSYQENYSNNALDVGHSLNQEINVLADNVLDLNSNDFNNQSIVTPTFEQHIHPHYESVHSWESYNSGTMPSNNEVVLKSTHHVLHSSRDANPYTTVGDDGHIYRHVGGDSTGDWVATVHDGKVHNFNNDYLGRAGTDGNVYDERDKIIGWVNSQGQVFDSAGHHVYDTTRGTVGAAAYLLIIYNGNVA